MKSLDRLRICTMLCHTLVAYYLSGHLVVIYASATINNSSQVVKKSWLTDAQLYINKQV